MSVADSVTSNNEMVLLKCEVNLQNISKLNSYSQKTPSP
jgi:hypothetical protein